MREPFPKEKVVAHVDSSGGQIVAKVFTAPDFITYVEEGMGEPGAFKRQQPAGYVAPAFSLEPAPASLPALDPAFEAHAAPLREVYARWLKATTADEQKALRKQDSTRRWPSPRPPPPWAAAWAGRPTRPTTTSFPSAAS